MAGGHMKYRHLSRSSSHRQALLRNLVTSLFRHESIATTWHKAKEAQRLAEKLVTLGKKNTEASRRRAHQIFYDPNELVPKLFGPIRERYASRPGGYTRVLRIEPMKEDQAESALLEFVDGPKDMRFAMTAKVMANLKRSQEPSKEQARKVEQVTKYRDDGVNELREMVKLMRIEQKGGMDERRLAAPQTVYPTEWIRRDMHYAEEVKFYKHPNKIPKGLKQRRLAAKKAGKKVTATEEGESDLVAKQVKVDEPAKQAV